jgi:hypothetical protein
MSHVHNICGNSSAVSEYQEYLARMAAARRANQGSASSGADELRSFDSAIDAEKESEGDGEGEGDGKGTGNSDEHGGFGGDLSADSATTADEEAVVHLPVNSSECDDLGHRVWRA